MKIAQAMSLKWFQNRNLEEKNKTERPRDSGHNYGHPGGFPLMWLIYQSVHSSCTYLWEVLYSALLAFLLWTWGLSGAPAASAHQRPVAPPQQACESKCLHTLSHAPERHSPLGRTLVCDTLMMQVSHSLCTTLLLLLSVLFLGQIEKSR